MAVAAIIGGCGGSDAHSRVSAAVETPDPTPSAARRHRAAEAAKQQRAHGALIAGPVDPAAVTTGVECTARVDGPDLIDCSSGQGVGGEDPFWLAVRLQADGTLSKVLGNADPVPGPKSSAQTSALLAADDRFQQAPSRSRPYTCRPSPRLDPDGRRADSDATGQLCTTYFRVRKVYVRRYVEFARDGTAIRDYVLHE